MVLAPSLASFLNPKEVNRPSARMACAAFCHRRRIRKLFNLSVLISWWLVVLPANVNQGCDRHDLAVSRLF